MMVGFKLFCLVIVSLCHEGLAIKPLEDSNMSLRILKRAGPEWNEPRGVNSLFPGNDPMMGNEKLNGQFLRIAKRKEQDRIIPDIVSNFHHFLLRYYTGCVEFIFYSRNCLQGNGQA